MFTDVARPILKRGMRKNVSHVSQRSRIGVGIVTDHFKSLPGYAGLTCSFLLPFFYFIFLFRFIEFFILFGLLNGQWYSLWQYTTHNMALWKWYMYEYVVN